MFHAPVEIARSIDDKVGAAGGGAHPADRGRADGGFVLQADRFRGAAARGNVALEAACKAIGRDPASIGRSAGIFVEPTDITGAAEAMAAPLQGSSEKIADGLRAFGEGGFTQVEILLWPRTLGALEAMAPVLDLLDAD